MRGEHAASVTGRPRTDQGLVARKIPDRWVAVARMPDRDDR